MHRLGMARSWAVLLTAAVVLAACSAAPAPAPEPVLPTSAPLPAERTLAVAPTPALAPTDAITAADALAPDPAEAASDEGGEIVSPQLASTATPASPAVTATDAPPASRLTAVPPAEADVFLPAASSTPTRTVPSRDPYPLQIDVMRQQSYPGSEITVEQALAPGANYNRYVVSYKSDGLKIYALMTVPAGAKPPTGWPVIVFNHGYIPPAQYRTTERYVAYVDAIARAGYIVFKSDYRGHGSSEGSTSGGGYGSPGYTDDVLNAVASLKAYEDADPDRIGMWGHSLGGSVTLRSMVVSKDIKAGVIWGGVVAPYPDIFARANAPLRPGVPTPDPTRLAQRYGFRGGRNWRQELQQKYGTPEQNPGFWASISPNSYLRDISGPLQLHHSTTDEEVPVAASKKLYADMQAAGKPADLFTYAGDNHNINGNFNTAMQRSIAFFDEYVKGQAAIGRAGAAARRRSG